MKADLRAQIVVVLLELRSVLKHVRGGGDAAALPELRDRAYGALSGYLRRSGAPFRLGFALPEVLLDGTLLRATRAGYEAAYEIGRILEELGGTELCIEPSLTAADFEAVLVALASAQETGASFVSPVSSLVVRGSLEGDLDGDPESPEYVANAYAAAVVAMRSLLGDLTTTRLLPPRAKRVGQGLVDLASTQLTLLLAAVTSDAAPRDAAANAVNAAILSIGILHQLGADRRLLSHVAMAALLCDVGDVGVSTEDAVPAHTVAALMSLGRLNEASVVRTVVAFETQWSERSSSPAYAGRRQTTLAARVLCVVRGYLALTELAPSDVATRIDTLLSQCGDEVDRSLVAALAAALQLPPMKSPSVTPPALDPGDDSASTGAAALATRTPSEAAPPTSALEVVDVGWSDFPPSQDAPAATSGEVPAEIDVSLESLQSSSELPASAAPTPGEPVPAVRSTPSAQRSLQSTAEFEAVSLAQRSLQSTSEFEAVSLDADAEKDESDPAMPTAPPPADAPSPRITRPVSIPPQESIPPTRPGEEVRGTSTPSAVPAVLVGQAEPTQPPKAQGSLSTQPISHVLLYALDQRLAGTIVFEEESARHKVFLQRGVPVQVATERPVSRIGQVLVRLGLTSAAVVERWVTQARAGQLFGELLVEQGVVSTDDLARALEAQMVERLAALSDLPGTAQYAFYEDENLLFEPGTSQLIPTSPLNALYATLRGALDEERLMGTLKRIWRIPLTFHPDADHEAYALTGEEDAVYERILQHRPTIDELLADRLVARRAALDMVYFLAVTRQLTWKGQKKGPIAPRGTRQRGRRIPPLPPRVGAAATRSTPHGTVKVRVLGEARPTPPAMNAVRLTSDPPSRDPSVTSTASFPAVTADQLASLDAPRSDIVIEHPPSTQQMPLTPQGTLAEPSSSRTPSAVRAAEFEHPNMVDPAAALRALVAANLAENPGQRKRELLRAAKLDPEDPELLARAARLGDAPATALAELAAQHPEHLLVLHEWAMYLVENDRKTEALEVFRRMLAQDPSHADAARAVYVLKG